MLRTREGGKDRGRMQGKTTKLSLEEYLDFLRSRNRTHLTVSSLNQIIQMHGFRKLHSHPKRVLLDAVEAIELVDPSRSTLHESISSPRGGGGGGARLSLADVIADVDELGWHECVVASVEIVGEEVLLSASDGSKRRGRPKKTGGGAFGCKRTASSGSETSGGVAGEGAPKRKASKGANAGGSVGSVGGNGNCSWSNQLEIGIRR